MANNEPRVASRLSNQDASFLFAESATNPMHGGPIFFLKGELPYKKLFRHMEERLPVAPRFHQRLIFPPFNLAHGTFEDDPDFKLENHVQRFRFPEGTGEAEAVRRSCASISAA